MLDTAIVGGGLCGLALASDLQARGCDYALFEARPRLGGRIMSVDCETAGMALDLGPSWFWPDTQPRITRLVAELGLNSIVQHDSGTVLRLLDPDKKPESVEIEGVHGGARRIDGGTARLAEALAARVPSERVHLEHELIAVRDRGDHAELELRHGDAKFRIPARRVVLALPPRLLEEYVSFEPALDATLNSAMRETPTWMAEAAKVGVGFKRAFWREAGNSGNAFSTHEQAALGEIFDACSADLEHAALGGFVALTPTLRALFNVGMPMLIRSQLVHFFGDEAEQGVQHFQDWTTEVYTCSTLDREPLLKHPEYGNALLQQPYWNGRLYFGGAETADASGGYMEGALDAAARLLQALSQTAPSAIKLSPRNTESVERFGQWVQAQRPRAAETYRGNLNRGLASQLKTQLTQRALLETAEGVYREALRELGQLTFDASDARVERGRSELTPQVLAPFRGFNEALLDEAVRFNRSSCAISNFPEEHEPPADYVSAIRLDLAAAWREFAISANALLLDKRGQL